MKTFVKALVLTIAAIQLLAVVVIISDSINTNGPVEAGSTFGVANFCGGVFFFIVGLIAAIRNDWRETGKGMMTASVIMVVIGTALCSQFLRL
jgi:hypothetical protein